MLNKLEGSIYRINTSTGSGTGFYSIEDNIIVTNYHVIAGNLLVSVENKDRNRFLANVIYINPGKDIAFLRVKGLSKPENAIHFQHENKCTSRDKVLVLGYPYGMPFTVTEGIVSNPKQVIEGQEFIQTDAAINPGNSGGPIINEKGELVGMVTSKFTHADNMGFAIPIDTLREEFEIVEDLEDISLTLGCHSCNGLITEKTDYCPNCGNEIDEKVFDTSLLSDLSIKVEKAISKLEINPILARSGREYWVFHQGSAEIRMFVYDNNYLFASSPLNKLPRKNLEELYTYILTEDLGKYRLSISDNKIYISYRIHISDLYSEKEQEILHDFAELAKKADELDDLFVEKFGAKMTHYSKEVLH